MKINFIKDEKINLEKDDLLGTRPYFYALSQIIEVTSTPFTIGLFGGWGVGKSSIIKTLEDKYNKDKNTEIEVFTYDAWKYTNDSFRRTFLLNFLKHFKLNSKDVESRIYSNKTQSYEWGLSKIFTYKKSKSLTYGKLIEPEIFEGVFQEALQQIAHNKNFSWKYFKEFIGFSKKVKKIVIVIDNLDRCHKDLAFELLLTIKNFLEQKNVVFIIPIDEQEIKKHIEKQGNNPNEFLRKLFNTTISIKTISEGDLFDFAKKLNTNYNLNFPTEVISIVAQQFSKNPRKIIQFLNVLQTERLLVTEQENSKKIPKGAVTKNISFYTKLLIIREEWPKLFNVLKNKPYMLSNINEEIIQLTQIELNEDQKNFLRRTNHIKPSHNKFELFFNNKDEFPNIPDITNKLVESNNVDGLIGQLNNKEIEFNQLIEFIDSRFEKALRRKEIRTTIVNIISLVFKLSNDSKLKKQINSYLYNDGKFLGGFKNFINSSRMRDIIKDIDSNILLIFIKKNESLTEKLLLYVISEIIKDSDNKQLLVDYLSIFKDAPEKLKKVSKRFSELVKEDVNFANETIDLLQEKEVIENLIKPFLINDFIEKLENNIEKEGIITKLEIIYVYHTTIGISKEQLKILITKIIGFINSTNDFVKAPFWLKTLKQYINSIEDINVQTNIYNSLNSKQSWLWQNYASSWKKKEYMNTLKIFLENVAELYSSISNDTQKEQLQKKQLITWLNQFFNKNESQELIRFINNLFFIIIKRFSVYNWPFSQNLITRYTQISDWETKKELVKTLNLMLGKTTMKKGLNENQILAIYRNYIKSMDSENQVLIIDWFLDSLKNSVLSKHFETVINELTTEKKIDILGLLKKLNKDELIENIIVAALSKVECENIKSIFEKLIEIEIDKETIRKSIKVVLRNIEKDDKNFVCLIEFLSDNSISDNKIQNLLAEKVKHIIVSENKSEVLFALKIIGKIKINDSRKLNAIKTLIQDINRDFFNKDELMVLKNIEKKLK